jgi:hypothetical protein
MQTTLALPKPSPWPRRLVIFGLIWAPLILILATLSEPTPENRTYLVSILGSGAYTWLLHRTREHWLPRLAGRPLRSAILLGIANAAVIETLFLVVERSMGAEGVAASPNLMIDLLVTMPWYAGMVILFVGVQHRRRFSAPTVLLLGGLYEVGADGMIGGLVDTLGGSGMLFTPAFWIMLAALIYWEFILVYSSMVLPPAWVIATAPPPPPPTSPAWKDALRPLRWLFPFGLYVLAILLLLGA